MKKAKSILFLSALALGAAAISGCSMFGGETGGFTSYDYSVDSSTGDAYLTFYLDDEWADPFVVKIPNRAGTDGIGIDDVLINRGDTSVTLTILYTDGRSSIFSLPYGKDGLSVNNVTAETDPTTGDLYLTFKYGETPVGDPIRVPMGNGIASITPTPVGDTTIITIAFTDPDMNSVSFEITNGLGIASVEVNGALETNTQYCLTITYSNGETQDVYLDKPISTHWYHGSGAPTAYPNNIDTADAKAGDYYLDTASGWVYVYENDAWYQLFCMKAGDSSTTENYFVTFYPNGGYWNGDPTDTASLRQGVQAGHTMDLADIPVPEHATATFKGWFTDPTNVNAGQFTDLTVVTKSISLYARWSE